MSSQFRFLLLVSLITSVICAVDKTSLEQICKNNGNPLHISFLTIPTKGHVNPFLGIGQQLGELGCKVTIPIAEGKKSWANIGGIEVISIPGEEPNFLDQVEYRRNFTNQISGNPVQKFWAILSMINQEKSKSPLNAIKEMQTFIAFHLLELNKEGKYTPDMIVTERMLNTLVDFGHSLGVPVHSVNPGLYFGSREEKHHFIPSFSSSYTQNMTYFQRVVNYLLFPEFSALFRVFVEKPVLEARVELGIADKVPEYFSTNEFHGVELFQTCWGFDYPRPVTPNVHLVGPILPLTLKPIPEHILSWIDSDDRDVVYMCMGTVATILPGMVESFFKAFEGQDYRVLWALPLNQRDILEGLEIPSNVYLESFVPQREILLQDKVKVFISHTGASSTNEAMLAAKPVVCMPFFGDQHSFCSRVVDAGCGFYLDKTNLDSEDIKHKVHTALTDPNVLQNSKRVQKLMNCGGSLKAAEILLESHIHGTEQFIPSVYQLPWYQKSAWDIFATEVFLTLLVPTLIYLGWKLLKCCCCCCCGKKGALKLKLTNQQKLKKQ